jgi:polysaccharide pyruvyl transferase WcaK-like protein
MIAEEQIAGVNQHGVRSHQRAAAGAYQVGAGSRERGPRIALLTPYSGNNLGDAAIVDSIIANIRLRLPDAQFSGISLNCENFVERHGPGAFPLCGTDRPFHGMTHGVVSSRSVQTAGYSEKSNQKSQSLARIKRALQRVPVVGWCLNAIHAWARNLWRELRHCVGGYRFLRTQDLLIVAGGGQLDEEWGGPWGHPFTLFKWAVLARMAQIPYVITSVGACRVTSATSRFFLSAALGMAQSRSYRDQNSRQIAAGMLHRAAGDSVVPDPAFSLPSSDLPSPAGIRAMAKGRQVVAISPMAYAKPQSWPCPDRALYQRYLQQMAQAMSQLLARGYFLVIVWSALSDESVLPEVLAHLDDDSKKRVARQMHIPAIATWKDLVAALLDVDFLVASRLHSLILGFVSHKPTIAISFDPKVDWVMEDLGQTDYLLQIRDFSAEDVVQALDRSRLHRASVVEQIAAYRDEVLFSSAPQYDAMAEFAVALR